MVTQNSEIKNLKFWTYGWQKILSFFQWQKPVSIVYTVVEQIGTLCRFLCLFDLKVCLPTSVLEHIEANECVFKVSSSVKTSRGVGKIAMTQRRLFLLTDGRPGYVEVAQYRDLDVRLKEEKSRDTNTAVPSKIRLETAIYSRCCLCVLLFFVLGSKGLLSSLHAPANPRPEASCPGKEGNFWS